MAAVTVALLAAPSATQADDGAAIELALTVDTDQPGWQIEPRRASDELVRVHDDRLDREVLEIADGEMFTFRSDAEVDEPYVVEALVRLPDERDATRGYAILRSGVRAVQGEPVAAYHLRLTRQRNNAYAYNLRPTIAQNEPWWRVSAEPGERDVRWGANIRVDRRFTPEDISPLMNERMRLELEATVDQVEPAAATWRSLRIEVAPDRVRMHHNGFLVIDDERRVPGHGAVELVLQGEARLAALRVKPLEDHAPYVPVVLDDLRNDRGPVDGAALLADGRDRLIAGVPFTLIEPDDRGDHVDVSASVFRYRRATGYRPAAHPRFTYPSAAQVDPARLLVRVPARTYRRAWVLAAFDERPSHIPALTVRFVRPGEGWPIDATRDVPAFTASVDVEDARRVEVVGRDGEPLSLWAVPVELDAAALASDYREQGIFHLELTKNVQGHRAFPDPANYGSFQAGLPSGVRVYGLTLEEAPVAAFGRGRHNGNLYPYPKQPEWHIEIENQHDEPREARVELSVTDPYGEPAGEYQRTVSLDPREQRVVRFDVDHEVYGLHEVVTRVSVTDFEQSRKGTFLPLPPDTRRATWRNSRFGLWNWQGTHGTNPDPDENHRLMRALGVQTGSNRPWSERRHWGVGPTMRNITGRGVPAWSQQDPPDEAGAAAFRESVARSIESNLDTHRDLQYFVSFPEHSISLRTTHGVPPDVFGQPWWEYDERERTRIRAHEVMADIAREVVDEKAPNVDFLFGWGSPGLMIPFIRSDYDIERFDGFGLDQPQFERMPERQPRGAEPSSLYFLKREMQEAGIEDMPIIHVESYFHSSHELALGHRQQADMTVRTAALSMAWGTDRFLKCWSLHDCSNYWGSQHYGNVGLIARRPEYNPKHAADAFATMTQVLDLAAYERWLDVGSKSAYCIEFIDRGRRVYPVWTIRGTRPLTVTLNSANAELEVIDEHGNARRPEVSDEHEATVTLSPTPKWLVVRGGSIASAQVCEPSHDERPGEHHIVLDGFDDGWTYNDMAYPRYAENHWDVVREPGEMAVAFVESDERESTVMQVTLENAPEGKPMVGFYGIFEPDEPIVVPGKARALGLWGRGASAWNRVIFELEDANGEIFQSIGTRDAWNCDDIHSWSYFNFDGWRYMEFPLPGSAPGDEYREKDSVWWNHSHDGIVDLPVRVRRIIVETRTHMIYADEMLPVDSLTVRLDDLVAVYDDERSMSDEPIEIQRRAREDLVLDIDPEHLPNPIAELRDAGRAEPTRIADLTQPEDRRTGREATVSIEPVDGAEGYQVWISAYADGRGARVVSEGDDPEQLVRNLQAHIPLYFFATYTDADGERSQPSEPRRTVLADEFPMQ